MNRVIDSRVIFFLNEEKEDPYFSNKEIEEHIKDLKLIFEPYFERKGFITFKHSDTYDSAEV